MKTLSRFVLPSLAAMIHAGAATAATPSRAPTTTTPSQIIASAPPGDWVDVAADDLLILDLAGGGRVAIELAPAFAPVHIANIRMLVRAAWFDDTSVNRVQDNYVVQWADASERKELSIGTIAHPPAEYERAVAGTDFVALPYRDAYAPQVGHARGWPAASDGKTVWLTHCYGMVGVGRGGNPDTGSGAELYTVIGHAPRHLDRNIAVVGRVLGGMEALSALPRGTAPLGFYARPDQRVPIGGIKLASMMPPAERPAF